MMDPSLSQHGRCPVVVSPHKVVPGAWGGGPHRLATARARAIWTTEEGYMLGRKTYTALRRMVDKALDDAEGDPKKAFSLVRTRLNTGTTRDLELREALVDHAVVSVLSDISMEAPEKIRGGLMEMVLPV